MDELEVMVLAAGKGTRMCSDSPKVLHRVCGKTLIERTLRAVAGCSPSRVAVVVGYGAEAVRAEVGRLVFPFTVVFSEQRQQLGTGHAAKIGLQDLGDGPSRVLIVPGDIPLLSGELLAKFVEDSTNRKAPVAVLSCNHPQPFGFGRIVRSSDGAVQQIVEEKDASAQVRKLHEINTSVYLCDKGFLAEALAELKPENAQGELYLTDIVALAVARKAQVSAYVTEDVPAVTGANTRYEMSLIEKTQRQAINRRHMEAGVTFEDADAAYIDEEVTIARDCYIGAGTRLRGKTVIAAGVTIEGNSLIEDAEIGAHSLIKLGCYFKNCKVGSNCEIGPFAQLRPETVLHDGVKIGNFVELKKAEMHAGAKANHLSYIGDAEVGANSNIGAGTIFCNYDGVNKHRSTLGEGVFIGSNSVLVAPVKLEKGAYVGAGSAVTKDVPAGALAVGRGRQTNIEGWAAKRNNAKKK